MEQVNSLSGDSCHYNIVGITDAEAKAVFSKHFDTMRDGNICNGQSHRSIEKLDLESL